MAQNARVLVVYKKDAYQQYLQGQRDPRLIQLLRRGHPDVVDMRRAHAVHEEALDGVTHALRTLQVDFDLADRADVSPVPRLHRGASPWYGVRVRRRYDLIVSVGGDGTFLQAARSVTRTPILGVNSDPSRSEAVFCAATRRTFATLCRLALARRLPRLRLYRLELLLNGRRAPQRALNDVLIAHDDPATMSRYRLRVGGREELQKSSGVWISTAAGSSSAVLAAGGVRLPWGSRRFQYRPRELYQGRLLRSRLTGSILAPTTSVRVTWLMRRGCVFLDGPRVKIPLRFADRIEVRLATTDPLDVLGLRPA